MGKTPQPALALIRLAQGKVKAAASAIESALSEASWNQWAKVRLLPAQVEIAIAAGELALARTAAEELGRIVDTYKSPALEAGKHQALARVLLAEGDAGRRRPGSPHRDPPLARGRVAVRGRQGPGAPLQGPPRGGRRRLRGLRAPGRPRGVRAARRQAGRGRRRARAAGRHGTSIRACADPQDVHVHRHRRVDESRGAPRQRAMGAAPPLARRQAPRPRREARRRDRQFDRRRLLRRIRFGAPGDRVRTIDPARARRAPPGQRLRDQRPDRPPFGRSEPSRRRLQRRRRSPGGAGRARSPGEARSSRPRTRSTTPGSPRRRIRAKSR